MNEAPIVPENAIQVNNAALERAAAFLEATADQCDAAATRQQQDMGPVPTHSLPMSEHIRRIQGIAEMNKYASQARLLRGQAGYIREMKVLQPSARPRV